jgi:hypothetical protein
MLSSRSIFLLYIFLKSTPALARAPNDIQRRDTSPNEYGGLFGFFNRFQKQKKDVIECNQDAIWSLMGSDLGKTACSILFSSPNATVTSTGTLTK